MDDIPEPLTRLVRLIMKGFYNVEHKIIVDMLIRRRETKEDDLIDVLKFERKHLRSLIQQLKQDRFISVRLIVETGVDGKSTRHNYYSINYRMFVNVVKYKIDHMRRKLETEERDLTSRSSFICESCAKTFTDLEADQIYDPMANRFRCSFCDGSVVEDPNVQPKADSRLVMAKYNQQMEPIYLLLQETENIKWSILEADRNNLANNLTSTTKTIDMSGNGAGASGNAASSTSTTTIITSASGSTTEIVVDIKKCDDDDWLTPLSTSHKYNKIKNEIDGANGKIINNNSDTSTINPDIEALLLREEGNKDDNFQQLQPQFQNSMVHSPTTSHIYTPARPHQSQHNINSLTNAVSMNGNSNYNHHNGHHHQNHLNSINKDCKANNNDSFMEDGEDDDDESAPMVIIGSQCERVPITKITDEHIKMMSKQQKDDYVRMMQQIYSILYD